jgi:hypothetical protein
MERRKIMKHLLIITVLSLVMPNFADAQNSANIYQSSEIENSEIYKSGNDCQKDFLLFIDLLRTTHPAFTPSQKPPFDLDSVLKVGFNFLSKCTDIQSFGRHITAIAAKLRDGHTFINSNLDKNGLLYLFQIQIHYPNVNLILVPNEFSSQLGKNIVKINGNPVFDVINSFKDCMSSENDNFFYKQIGGYMQFFSLWQTNQYFSADSVLNLTFSDGNEIRIKPQFRPSNMEGLSAVQRTGQKANSITQPQRKPFFYTILDDESICYFQFNQCVDNSTLRWRDYISGKHTADSILDKTLSNVPRFDVSVSRMFDEIKDKNIKTLVVDVRNNGGGNSVLCEILLSWLKPFEAIKSEKSYTRFSPFFEKFYPTIAANALKALQERNISFEMGNIYLSSDLDALEQNTEYKQLMDKYFHYNKDENRVFNGNVIFIQGKGTYSSAGLLITDAIDNGIGTVIGEKSIYRPCNYGDILMWQLPNTKISGGISHKIFNRPNEGKCNEDYIVPNILIEESLDNTLQGEDKYWSWIIDNYTK